MAFKITAKIEGLEDLVKLLRDELPKRMQSKILRPAMRRACKKVVKSARSKLGKVKRTGQLRKSIGAKIKVYRRSGVVVGIVGPRTGFRVSMSEVLKKQKDQLFKREMNKGVLSPGANRSINRLQRLTETIAGQQFIDPTKYAHLIEKGTKAHPIVIRLWGTSRKVTIQHPGSPAHPFLRPALDENIGNMRRIYETEIRDGLAQFRVGKMARDGSIGTVTSGFGGGFEEETISD